MSPSSRRTFPSSLVDALLLLAVGCSGAGIESDVTDAVGGRVGDVGLEDLLDSDPPITTSGSDAVEGAARRLPEPARAALRARAELRRRYLDAEE